MTCIIIKNNHNIRILNDKYIRIYKAIDIFFQDSGPDSDIFTISEEG